MTEVGSIVRALQDAQADRLLAERLCEELLLELLPGWLPRFPRARGWWWTHPAELDVWGAIDSPAAADALARAGFTMIRLHDHERGQDCACPTRKI